MSTTRPLPVEPPTFTFRPRAYLHLDAPVSRQVAEALVTDPAAVAQHPFYPFLTYVDVTRKIRKKTGGGVELRPPKERPIAYAAHRDAHIYAHYSQLLEVPYEAALRSHGLHEAVTAFRRRLRRSNIHLANEAFDSIVRLGPCFVLTTDVSDFFNQIGHRQLKRALIRVLGVEHLPEDFYAVFKAITRYCTVERSDLYRAIGLDPRRPRADGRRRLCSPREFRERVRGGGLCRPNTTGRGIPQGSSISALLANVSLLAFDALVHGFVTRHGGLYRRYCDDILVVLPTAGLRAEAHALIVAELQALGLEAHPDKTERTDFGAHPGGGRLFTPKPLNYLGFTFDGRHKRVRQASVARFYRKMRRGVARTRLVRRRVMQREGSTTLTPLRRRQLHVRYSYLGRHNFPSYVFRAARIMQDPGMKRQVKAHWRHLQALIREGDGRR